MMKLHGVPLSPFVRKVVVALGLKGLEYEHINVMPASDDAEFRKLSPLGKIPAFEDGDLGVSDSSVICEYLEEQYPAVSLRPTSPVAKARARWYEEYADTKLVELCGAGIFFEVMLKPMMLQQETDHEKVQNTINNLLPPQLDYLESQLPEQDFLFGDKLGIADISIVCPFINADYADYRVDGAKWPKVASFIDRVKAEPVFAKQLEVEAKIMASMKPS